MPVGEWKVLEHVSLERDWLGKAAVTQGGNGCVVRV